MQVFYWLIALSLIVLMIFMIWRLASIRRSIPCPSWLGWMVETDNFFAKANRAEYIIEELKITTGMKVMDIGCGPGRITLPLAEKVGPEGLVYAFDIQDKMLNRVKEKADLRKINNIVLKKIYLGEEKLERLDADRGVLVTVLGEIPEKEKALNDIFMALKPGGVLAVSEIMFDPHYQSRKKVLKLATAVGFKEKQFIGNRIAFTILLEKP